MATDNWHQSKISIIVLPSGENEELFLDIVEEWTRCWMLKPAFWVQISGITEQPNEEPRVSATLISRNGRRDLPLMDCLSGEDLTEVRLLAIRTGATANESFTDEQSSLSVLNKIISESKPYKPKTDSIAKELRLSKINLIFAPSRSKGVSFTNLLERSWNMNVVVAPEDRGTPSNFDKATRNSTVADKDAWYRFLISNAAIVAGIWAGTEGNVFDFSSQFKDLPPIQGQVIVMRSFVRGVLSEGLSTRVTADALSRSGSANTSKIDGSHAFPNPYFEAYEEERVPEIIDQMVDATINFSGGRLEYKSVKLKPDLPPELSGVVAGIKYFFKSSSSLFRVLPLWIFASLWNRIALTFSRLIFGDGGRKRIVGTVEFPRTNLDLDAEIDSEDINKRLGVIRTTLEKWPVNFVRRSEPTLWAEMRKLILGRLDASPLPGGIELETGVSGKKIIGDLNAVLPDINERWELPEDINRSVSSQVRSTSWQEVENIADLTHFFSSAIPHSLTSINALSTKNSKIAADKAVKEDELDALISQLEEIRYAKISQNLNAESIDEVRG
jgi:hypothetical protein